MRKQLPENRSGTAEVVPQQEGCMQEEDIQSVQAWPVSFADFGALLGGGTDDVSRRAHNATATVCEEYVAQTEQDDMVARQEAYKAEGPGE